MEFIVVGDKLVPMHISLFAYARSDQGILTILFPFCDFSLYFCIKCVYIFFFLVL